MKHKHHTKRLYMLFGFIPLWLIVEEHEHEEMK